jgi:integrase
MGILTNVQLNNAINTFIGVIAKMEPQMYDFCLFNYNYGFRYHELKDYTRWINNGDGTATCNTEKGSNDRTLNWIDLPIELRNAITFQSEAFGSIRYSTFTRLFKRYFKPNTVNTLHKGISSHIFRHNLVKLKHDNGMSFDDIATFLGEVDTGNIVDYYHSIIYY